MIPLVCFYALQSPEVVTGPLGSYHGHFIVMTDDKLVKEHGYLGYWYLHDDLKVYPFAIRQDDNTGRELSTAYFKNFQDALHARKEYYNKYNKDIDIQSIDLHDQSTIKSKPLFDD